MDVDYFNNFFTAFCNVNRFKLLPLAGSIEVTYKCNLRCLHCYARREEKCELSSGDFFNIIKSIKNAGCFILYFTGGEPFLRKDFLDIYTFAKKKGFLIKIFSNGTLLSREVAQYLARWKPLEIEITLYAMDDAVNDAITGIKGSTEAALKGIHIMKSFAIPFSLKAMVTNINKKHIDAIKKFARKLNVAFRLDPILHPVVREGVDVNKQIRLKPKDVISFDEQDGNCARRIGLLGRYLFPEKSGPYCPAGFSSFNITPVGKLTTCVMSTYPSLSFQKHSFKKSWSKLMCFHQSLRQETGANRCKKCKDILLCSKCPGWLQHKNESLFSPSAYLCDIAKLRSEAMKG